MLVFWIVARIDVSKIENVKKVCRHRNGKGKINPLLKLRKQNICF